MFMRRRLAAVQDRFEEWVVLGKVDIEELVSFHCKTYEDFESNFKMVKLKGEVIHKIGRILQILITNIRSLILAMEAF